MYIISLTEFGMLENAELLGSTIQCYIAPVCNKKDGRETSCPAGGINQQRNISKRHKYRKYPTFFLLNSKLPQILLYSCVFSQLHHLSWKTSNCIWDSVYTWIKQHVLPRDKGVRIHLVSKDFLNKDTKRTEKGALTKPALQHLSSMGRAMATQRAWGERGGKVQGKKTLACKSAHSHGEKTEFSSREGR